MHFDIERIKETANALGMTVTVNSENPGVTVGDTRYTWDEICEKILEAFKPLGDD